MSKITVSPTGEVLIEFGRWDAVHNDWDYQHSRAKVKRRTADAFAASLSEFRPKGEPTVSATVPQCDQSTRNAGLKIEWIEFGRRDQLDVPFDCSVRSDNQIAQKILGAPAILGLQRIGVP
ncbi:hypothetical protein WBP07_22090 (plasmid) [Novosphingobium sp. BL-8A]|uniref:hypothetical protein n=1 Tax=Novosphingobium sp. BL-8A TaxID=3127639 RepID=UPI003757B8CB